MKVKLLFIALKIPGVIENVNNVDLKNHCLVVGFFFIFFLVFKIFFFNVGWGKGGCWGLLIWGGFMILTIKLACMYLI